MSTLTVNGSAVKKMTLKDSSGTEHKVKKWYHDGVKVFSSGNVCTYYVNTNDVHSEEIDSEASCLSPKTFTPSLSGWTFVGWREDKTAASSVLSSRIMGDDPVTLYAVFKKVTYTSGVYVTQWYNNGNWVNPCVYVGGTGYGTTHVEYFSNGSACIPPKTFTPAVSGWTFVGWRSDTAASSSVYRSYAMNTGIVTLYAVFKRTFSLSFANNYASGGSTSPVYGEQYYNSNNYANPQVTLPNDGYSRSGLTFVKWVLGAPGTKVTLTGNTTTRAVCKYNDNNSPLFYYNSSGGNWGAGIMKGHLHTIDGKKYSQIYMAKIDMEEYSIWIDNNASHTSFTWCRSPEALSANGLLFHACAGIYGGYSNRFFNGNDWSNGSRSLQVSNITVSLPERNVHFGGDSFEEDYGGLMASGIKLIGRTVS